MTELHSDEVCEAWGRTEKSVFSPKQEADTFVPTLPNATRVTRSFATGVLRQGSLESTRIRLNRLLNKLKSLDLAYEKPKQNKKKETNEQTN